MTDDDLRAILMQIKDLAMKPYPLLLESKIEDQDLLFILGQIVGLCVSGLVKKSDRPE